MKLITGWNIVKDDSELGTLFVLRHTEVRDTLPTECAVFHEMATATTDLGTAILAFAEALYQHPATN